MSRLLWRTSLASQVLHSGASFLMMAGMARFAPSEAFALAALFFLLTTLVSSLNVYVLSAAWLRTDAKASAATLSGLILLLCVGLALSFGLSWAAYRQWAFGPGSWGEALAVTGAAFSYLYYFAWRRQRLLEAEYLPATLADGLRALVILGGGWLLWRQEMVFDYLPFLALFVVAHGTGVLVMRGVHRMPEHQRGHWWLRSTRPLRAIQRGDWLGVVSGLANVVFSQAASLAAPMLIGAFNYASLRAYELFLFPVFFMAQVLDPLYMGRYRREESAKDGHVVGAAQILQPALLMFVPIALILLGAWAVPALKAVLLSVIAPSYHHDFGLLALVLALSAWISLNAPIRWRLTVAGAGSPLLLGTGVGIVCSLAVLAALTHRQAEPGAVLVAKMAYEACLAAAGLIGLWRLRAAATAQPLNLTGHPDITLPAVGAGIYIVFTRYQMRVALAHRRQYGRGQYALLAYHHSIRPPHDWLDHFDDNQPFEATTGVRSNATQHTFRLLSRRLDSLTAMPGARPQLLIASVAYPLSSRLIRKYADRVEVTLLADGLSAYLPLTMPLRDRAGSLMRRLFVAMRYGVASVAVRRHPHGLDGPEVHQVFAEWPERLPRCGKPVYRLPPVFEPVAVSGVAHARSGVWFLGQPHLSGVVDLGAHLKRLAQALRTDHPAVHRFVYKPHHFEGPDIATLVRAAGFELDDRPVCVEELMAEALPDAVYSYRSTALLNLRAMFPPDVPVVAFAPWLVQPPGEQLIAGRIEDWLHGLGLARPEAGSAMSALENGWMPASVAVPEVATDDTL